MEMMQKQRDAVGLTLLADNIEEWIPATPIIAPTLQESITT